MVTVTEAAPTETWTNVVIPIIDFNTLSADGKIGQIILMEEIDFKHSILTTSTFNDKYLEAPLSVWGFLKTS